MALREYVFTCPMCSREFTVRQRTFLWFKWNLKGHHICEGGVFTVTFQ